MTSPAQFRREFLKTDAQTTAEFQAGIDAHRAAAAQLRDNAQAQLAQIAGRTELTAEARTERALKVYAPSRDQLNNMLQQEIEAVKARKQWHMQQAFGSNTAADSTTAAARREARRIAAKIEDPGHARETIRDAQFDGDKELARAVARTAFERGWHDVLDDWNRDGSNNRYMQHVVDYMQMPDTEDVAWRFSVAASYVSPQAGPDLLGVHPAKLNSNYAAGDLGGEAA